MKVLVYAIILALGLIIGFVTGVVSKSVFDRITYSIEGSEVHMSSRGISANIETLGLHVPKMSYDLEYYFESGMSDWRKLSAFSAEKGDILESVESFLKDRNVKQTFELEGESDYRWPVGPEWWPTYFEKAVVYKGDGFSLAHDHFNNRIYVEVYTW